MTLRDKAILAAAATALFLNTSVFWAGVVEGRLFPVMGPLTVYDPQPLPPPSYQFVWKGYADKLRDCRYIRTEWFLGKRGGQHVGVNMGYTDPPTVRLSGRLHWDGIRIALSPDEVLGNSYAMVYHRCPGRWWDTATVFYDSEWKGE
jgi:hypothetical protein